MTVRKIVPYGDTTLRKKSKEVFKMSKKIQILIHDMLETMYANNGVGLAAPQVGENLRIFVIDVSTNEKDIHPMVFVNPKIISKTGACSSYEGCLSFPDAYTDVKRYANIKVKALNGQGKPFVIEGTDGNLLSRAIQHEFDHLDGILFIDHCRSEFETNRILSEKGLDYIEEDKLLDEPDLDEQLKDIPSNPGETVLPNNKD